MGHPEDCNIAYSYTTPNELKDYYNDIASAYNLFLESTNYILHINVANLVDAQWSDVIGNVLDIGCGSGKLGVEISKIKPKVKIDGIDFSENMIQEAYEWGVYNAFHNVNIKEDISGISQKYDLLVSSGAFTPGHLDFNDLLKIIPLLNRGGRAFIAVKKNLFEEDNFNTKLELLASEEQISHILLTEVLIWDDPLYADTAVVVSFERSG